MIPTNCYILCKNILDYNFILNPYNIRRIENVNERNYIVK